MTESEEYQQGWRDGCAATLRDCEAEVERLREKIRALQEEAEESDNLVTSLSRLLRETAEALKGPPDNNHAHSWHDLPEIAHNLRRALLDYMSQEAEDLGLY